MTISNRPPATPQQRYKSNTMIKIIEIIGTSEEHHNNNKNRPDIKRKKESHCVPVSRCAGVVYSSADLRLWFMPICRPFQAKDAQQLPEANSNSLQPLAGRRHFFGVRVYSSDVLARLRIPQMHHQETFKTVEEERTKMFRHYHQAQAVAMTCNHYLQPTNAAKGLGRISHLKHPSCFGTVRLGACLNHHHSHRMR